MTGSLGATIKSGALAFASAKIFQTIGDKFSASSGIYKTGGAMHIASHALTGGVISVLRGGKFGHGFLSAGLAKAANVNSIFGREASLGPIRVLAAAVIGGTVSKLAGGKFSNGATTAAFAQLFNGESQNKAFREQRIKLKPTDAEYLLVEEGRLAEMWKSRCERGDPIGCVGYATWGDPDEVGQELGSYWKGIGELTRKNAYYGLYSANGEAPTEDLMLKFGQDIALAHLDATAADHSSVWYYLSAPEITSYHHTVFDAYGVSRGWYGGSYLDGYHSKRLEFMYCQPACDYGKY